jgi:hypothetical protein
MEFSQSRTDAARSTVKTEATGSVFEAVKRVGLA